MAETLTGAFLDISIVEIAEDGTETETLLTRTTEDVEVERDPNEIDWGEHGNPRRQRREGQETTTMTFSMVLTDDQQNLQDAGIVNSEGQVRRNVIHDEVRVYVYLNEADMETDNVALEYYAQESQFVFETMTLPMEDVSVIETPVWVHGEHGFRQQA